MSTLLLTLPQHGHVSAIGSWKKADRKEKDRPINLLVKMSVEQTKKNQFILSRDGKEMTVAVSQDITVGEFLLRVNQALKSQHPQVGDYVGLPGTSPKSSILFDTGTEYRMNRNYDYFYRLALVAGGPLHSGQKVIVTQWLEELEEDDTSGSTTGGGGGGGVMNINTALPEVLKTSLIHGGLARGLREAARAMEKKEVALLCLLAGNCDDLEYNNVIEGLCAEHKIKLIKVADKKKLGEWVGLCKIDREGKPRKVVGCSCAVITDYGKESHAKDVIEKYFKDMK